ncbi:hypothetical protein ACFY78_24645 [Streptomyces olindensis]|uniref:hypothetical protein n=1 Tax=Streptomyces olindensis TaxID=358823 RepID=UPI0036C6E914
MTTCSSSPRSNEPAIPSEPNGSAQPSAETTVATGTYQVEQTSAQPADAHQAGPAGAEPVALGSHPVAGSAAQPTAPGLDQAGQTGQTGQTPVRPAAPATDQSSEQPVAAPGSDPVGPADERPVAASGPGRADPAAERPVVASDSGQAGVADERYPATATDSTDPTGPMNHAPAPPAPGDLTDGQPGAPVLDGSAPGDARPGPSALDEPAPASATGPGEPEQSGARPFVIRSLDDNPVELRPGTGQGTGGAPYGDAVSDLVHAAVADRPLEEVVDLITSLEESPDHTQAKVDALRTAGVTRPVEDVSRLIALLTKPPRDADCADEAIRAAAAHRPVEEVTRLVTLLHKEPQEPHVREEALRAAATGRSVGELVELIDRLGLERLDRNGRPPNGTSRPGGTAAKPGTPVRTGRRRAARRAAAGETHRTLDAPPPDRERAQERFARSVSWSGWLAALALAVCAVAHFPLQRGDASLRLHAFALGLSVLCTVLALLLALRPVAVVLAGAVLVPTVLAGAQAYGSSFPAASLSRAVDLALAPPWLAAAVAVCAALLALVALVFRVLAPIASRDWTPAPAPVPEAGPVAE